MEGAQAAVQRTREVESEVLSTPANQTSIAIVGMACRFPGASTIETFWRNLRDGVESIRVFSDHELREAGVSGADLQQRSYVKAGVLLEAVRLFDAEYFGMTPREASLTSPEQRLLIECAEEALQDGGYGDRQSPPRDARHGDGSHRQGAA